MTIAEAKKIDRLRAAIAESLRILGFCDQRYSTIPATLRNGIESAKKELKSAAKAKGGEI